MRGFFWVKTFITSQRFVAPNGACRHGNSDGHRLGDGWAVEHDGRTEGDGYLSKEAALEAIAAAASNSIKEGYEILISVPGTARGQSALV